MKNYFIILGLAVVFLGVGHSVSATTTCVAGPDGYCALSPLPGISDVTGKTNLNTYIKGMFQLAIGLAGVLAVLRIIMGGITYMTTDAFDGKSDAKETIRDAIIGLLLAISAYTILATVNPKLVDFQFGVEGLRLGAPISSSSTPPVEIQGGNVTSDCIVDNNGTKVSCTCINCANAKDVPFLSFKNNSTMSAGLLQNLKTAASQIAFGWQVTEAWPPSSPHSSSCHNNGRCVDANLTTNKYVGGKPTAAQVAEINAFAGVMRKNGLGVIFEVNTANYKALSEAKVDEAILRDVSKSSTYKNNIAPSFHISY